MATSSLQGWRLEGSVVAEIPLGPSDREVIETLQRVASAQAHLAQAEADAAQMRVRTAKADLTRDRAVDSAHVDVVWAQADVLSSPRSRRAAKGLRMAVARERAALRLYGFDSYAAYEAHRSRPETTDPHLALARRECASADEAWQLVQSAFAPTVIIDLTGDDARVIV